MTDKTKMIYWYVCLAALAASISYAAYHLGHPTIAVLVIIIPVALIVNGFLAEVEDIAPGGFLSEEETDGAKEGKKKAKFR